MTVHARWEIALLGFVTLGTLAVASACSDSDDSSVPARSYAGSCDELASRCHGVETAVGVDCHDLGHEGDDTRCGPRRDECLAACPEHEPSHGEDAATDSGTSSADAAPEAGPSAECTAYCACMKTSCAAMSNYPFEDESTCFAACASFSAEERACFAFHCDEASASGSPDHACDHATGKLGLAECP